MLGPKKKAAKNTRKNSKRSENNTSMFKSTFDSLLSRFSDNPNTATFHSFTQRAKIKFIKGSLSAKEKQLFLNVILKQLKKMFIKENESKIFDCKDLNKIEEKRIQELCTKYPLLEKKGESNYIQFNEKDFEEIKSQKEEEITNNQLINDLILLVYQFLVDDLKEYIFLLEKYETPKVFIILFRKFYLKDCDFRYILLVLKIFMQEGLMHKSLLINRKLINLFFNFNLNIKTKKDNLGLIAISFVFDKHTINCNTCQVKMSKIFNKTDCCEKNSILFKTQEAYREGIITNKYLNKFIKDLQAEIEKEKLKDMQIKKEEEIKKKKEVEELQKKVKDLEVLIDSLRKGSPKTQNIPQTSSLPPLPGKTGTLPPLPGKTGSLPPLPGKTGSLPPLPGKTGSLPPLPGKTGTLPPLPGKVGGLPPLPGKGGLPPLPKKGGLPPLPGKGCLPGKGGLPPINVAPKTKPIRYIEIPLSKQKVDGKLFNELPVIQLNDLELKSLQKQIKEVVKTETKEIEKFLMNPKKINAIEICLRSGELMTNEELKNRINYQEAIEENRIKVLLDCWPSKPESFDLLDFCEFEKKKKNLKNTGEKKEEYFKGVKKLTRCEELYLLFMFDTSTNKYSVETLEACRKKLCLNYFLIRFETLNPVILKSIDAINFNCKILRQSKNLVKFLTLLISIYNSTVPVNKQIKSLDYKNLPQIFDKQYSSIINIISNKMNLSDLVEDLDTLNMSGVMTAVNGMWGELLVMYSDLNINIKEVQSIKDQMEITRKEVSNLEEWLGCEMDKEFLKILGILKTQIRTLLDVK